MTASAQRNAPAWARTLLAGLALGLSACASPPPVHFHTLRPGTATVTPPDSAPQAWQVVVGPVTLPPLLDRAQWVIRRSDTEVQILEQQRWAQALDADIADTFAWHLSHREQTASGQALLAYPETTEALASSAPIATARIQLQVLRMDSGLTPAPWIDDAVRWTLRCAQPLPRPPSPATQARPEPPSGVLSTRRELTPLPEAAPPQRAYEQLASAHAMAVAAWARALADQVREFAPRCSGG